MWHATMTFTDADGTDPIVCRVIDHSFDQALADVKQVMKSTVTTYYKDSLRLDRPAIGDRVDVKMRYVE